MDITKGTEETPFKHHLDEVEEKRRKKEGKGQRKAGKRRKTRTNYTAFYALLSQTSPISFHYEYFGS